jgi:c-di-GMP-binding flagellar brake protein YcgR
MAGSGWSERRRHVRVTTRLKATLVKEELPNFSTAVTLRDVSIGGIGFIATSGQNDELEALGNAPGPVVLEIDLDKRRRFRAHAHLVWGSRIDKRSRYLLAGGMSFSDVDQRDRNALLDYISERARRLASQRLKAVDPMPPSDSST